MFKSVKELIGAKFPPNYLSRGDQQDIESIILEASEQAFNAGRAYRRHTSLSGVNIEIDKPASHYIYPLFVDFKLDKL